MKILSKLTLAAAFAASLSACGGVSNTLPPMGMYPGQLPPQYTQPMLPGTPGNPVSNDTLPSDITQGQFGSIVGRVISRSGAPLHNVQVALSSDPSIKTTTRRGDFTLMNVPAGNHSLTLSFGEISTTVQVNVLPNMATAPAQNPIQLDGEPGSNALAFASPNKQIAAFKTDQDFLNQWQAKSIEVSNGTLYISAIDTRNITRKGTVIKMNAADGQEWKNIASAWLGLRHPLNATARGLSMSSSGSILVVDEKGGLFSVDSAGKVTKSEADSGLDIACASGTCWIYSVRGLEKSDDSGTSRSLISGVSASGGIGVDGQGNAYVPVQSTIVKVDAAGAPTPLIRNYLNSPTDVAVDPRNGDIYVLDGGEIKRFDKNGEFVVSFGSSALDPSAIAVDEEGALYVADFARDHRSSQIIKFEPVPLAGGATAGGLGSSLEPLVGSEEASTEEEFVEEESSDEFADDEFSEEEFTEEEF
ncbi:MAG: hypothetical protein CVV27_02165 [Candidatus Melainabacteria bacterium HGW-Melainabacteria-1]|nr:MAG: hypothetical protein CVV27_02165 [Candidatus Melainabacteria bacterium HGW-Melainabacteria-1]